MRHYFLTFQRWLFKARVRQFLLWIVAASYADMFIKNGWIKFDPEGFWTDVFIEKWGYPVWFLYLVGVVEVVGGVFILLPRTRPFASLALGVIMLGAFGTRLIHGFRTSFRGDHLFDIIYKLDIVFFTSTIAIFLYFFSLALDRSQGARRADDQLK